MGASFTLGSIAEALGATLEGDPHRLIGGGAPLDKAGPEPVPFLVNPRQLRAAMQSAAGAVVVGRGVEGLPQALLRVDSAQAALSRPAPETRRIWAAETMLPELVRKVRALKKRVRELEGRAGG